MDFVSKGKAGRHCKGGQWSEIRTGAMLPFAIAESVAGEAICDWNIHSEAEVLVIDVSGPMFGHFAGFVGPTRNGAV